MINIHTNMKYFICKNYLKFKTLAKNFFANTNTNVISHKIENDKTLRKNIDISAIY